MPRKRNVAVVGPDPDDSLSKLDGTALQSYNDRPPVVWGLVDDERVLMVRASSIGLCIRSLVLAGRGVAGQSAPEWLQVKFNEGKTGERALLDDYLKDRELVGRVEPDFQQRVLWRPSPALPVVFTGSLDLALPDNITEAKLFAPSTWEAYLRHGLRDYPYYEWQTSIYQYATGKTLDFLVGLKDEKGNYTGEYRIDHFPQPLINKGKILKKAMAIYKGVVAGSGDVACDTKTYPCPHFYLPGGLCEPGNKGTDNGFVPTGEERSEWLSALGQLAAAKLMEEEAKTAKRLAGEKLNELADKHKDWDPKIEVSTGKWKGMRVKSNTGAKVKWANVPADLKKQVDAYKEPGKDYTYWDVKVDMTVEGKDA